MLLESVRERVDPALAGGGERHRAGLDAVPAGEVGRQPQPGAAERVALQAAVPHRPEHCSRPAPTRERLAGADPHPAVVDLVARHRSAEGGPDRGAEHLVVPERGRRLQQAEAVHARPGRALHPVGVGDLAAEHLEATADAEHHTASRGVVPHGVGQPLLAQPRQVGDRRPAAGQYDDVGCGQRPWVGHEGHLEARFEAQRVDVGEVADPWEPHHRHPQPRPGRVGRHRTVTHRERVLGVQPQVRQPRQHAEERPPGHLLDERRARAAAGPRRHGTC